MSQLRLIELLSSGMEDGFASIGFADDGALVDISDSGESELITLIASYRATCLFTILFKNDSLDAILD